MTLATLLLWAALADPTAVPGPRGPADDAAPALAPRESPERPDALFSRKAPPEDGPVGRRRSESSAPLATPRGHAGRHAGRSYPVSPSAPPGLRTPPRPVLRC